jgi:nicotinamidase-related amidase
VARKLELQLNLRRRILRRDAGSRAYWDCVVSRKSIPASEVAVLICDMWDNHWSRGAAERCAEIAARMNDVVKAARAHGVTIIHAPSDTMDYYEDTPARRRAVGTERVDPPPPLDHPDPPLPIDDSDEGSDTGDSPDVEAWSRQHPAIEIADDDYISDDGGEVYSILRARGLRQVVIMGVHTNMCVLHRSFGIKQMLRWGVDIALARDLTDTMYNPEMPPYVSHDEGTGLVVEFIEKFWCPSLAGSDLMNSVS